MKSHTEMNEGPQAYTQFENTMKRVLAVSHAVIRQRIEAERKLAALNTNKRGPKPKAKPST